MWMQVLEHSSKAVALLVFVCYAVGFIVVSVRDASFGFGELSPFKPRILSAGLLFTVLSFVAALSAHLSFSAPIPTGIIAKIARAMSRCWMHLFGSVLIASGLSPILVGGGYDFGQLPLWGWWLLIPGVMVFLALTGAAVLHYERFPRLTILLFAVLVPLETYWLFYDSPSHASSAVALWFFFLGLVSVSVHRQARSVGLSLNDVVYPTIVALSFFPTHIYPRVRQAWGGGEPTAIVAYFSQDARLFPGEEVQARLLDESDQGFYLLLDGETRALYVPRSAVSAVFFSQSGLKSSSKK